MSEVSIFYTDDDDDDLFIFNEAVECISNLSEKTVNLHIHKNGENLLENIKKNTSKNKVVFLDINMPKKNGFEFLEEIRNELEINQTPIIIFSTSDDVNNISISHDLGANFYAIKPSDFNDLKKIILIVIQMDWHNHKADIKNFLFNKLIP